MVFEKICKIIAEQLNIDEDSIDINTDLVEDLGADSLDKVELVMAIEDEFGITIPDEDTNDAMVTVGEIAEYVENLL